MAEETINNFIAKRNFSLKVEFLKSLVELAQVPHVALNKRESLRTLKNNNIKDLTIGQLNDLLESEVVNNRFTQSPENKGKFECGYDTGRIVSGVGIKFLTDDEKNKISTINKLIFEAVVFEAIAETIAELQSKLLAQCSSLPEKEMEESQKNINKAIEEFQKELEQLAVEAYIRPRLAKTPEVINKQEIAYVNDVLKNCENELKHAPASQHAAIGELAKSTVKGLMGDFNMESYTATINNLPHERKSSRILIGAACIFAGVLLIGAAIATMVLTSGASTPLTLLGITVGVKMVIAGTATAGAIGLGLVGFGAFFANTKPEKAEATKAIEPAAIDFSKYKGGPAGG